MINHNGEEVFNLIEVNQPNEKNFTYNILNIVENLLAQKLEKDKRQKTIDLFKKTPAVLIGSYSGLPYLNAASSLAGDNIVLKYLFSYGAIVGIGCLASWILINLTNEFEFELLKNKKLNYRNLLKKISFLAVSIMGGLITASPSAYIGYYYNNKSLFWTLSALVTDAILYSYSVKQLLFRNSFKRYLVKINSSEEDKLIIAIQDELIYQLNDAKKQLKKFSSDDWENLQNQIDLIDEKSKKLLTELLILSMRNSSSIDPSSTSRGRIEKIIKLTSLIFVFSWEIVNFILAFRASQLLINNMIVNVAMTIFPVLLSTILQFELSNHTYIKIYRTLSDYKRGEYNASLAYQYYPKISLMLGMIGFITAFLSFATRAKITTDLFPSIIGIILACFVSVSTVAYKITAIFDLNKDGLEYFARNFSKKHKISSNLYCKIDEFIKYIETAQRDDFNQFLCDIEIGSFLEILNPDTKLASLINKYTSINNQENCMVNKNDDEISTGENSKRSNFKFFKVNTDGNVSSTTSDEISNSASPPSFN